MLRALHGKVGVGFAPLGRGRGRVGIGEQLDAQIAPAQKGAARADMRQFEAEFGREAEHAASPGDGGVEIGDAETDVMRDKVGQQSLGHRPISPRKLVK